MDFREERFKHVRSSESIGPWPFITRTVYKFEDSSVDIWSSRHARKNLILPETLGDEAKTLRGRQLWAPATLNWWIGIIFALGASLFVTASVLTLLPNELETVGLSATQVNAVYFAGSIPFTLAAYLQLYQSNHSQPAQGEGKKTDRPTIFLGWKPANIGWISCLLQFLGTVLFNVNTFDAMIPSLNWFQQDLFVWVPNFVGSVFFLASGYLAFAEVAHAYWSWNTSNLSWWVVFVNLLGCLFFMASALCAFITPGPVNETAVTLATLFTLVGAVGFFVGAVLSLPEASQTAS
ncbi:hypothetical protein KOR42_22080 [Thalassoglobus neptunius]|uniref:YrhK domain-containing protein n=1 Tax=Thalassoglobus neptunius TaxID=1938619 RepID=A0A5C5XAD3_9PLAN|nr:hypothetical protein [Thalassoglobus neptunius]TWT58822.1 hypothetical protein KOR42_22080 [Thalassoglobus neptunius]